MILVAPDSDGLPGREAESTPVDSASILWRSRRQASRIDLTPINAQGFSGPEETG